MTTKKQIREFIDRWDGQGHEKQETQKFWLDLMQNVLGMTNAIHNTEFEHKTASGGFIDVLCPDARFLVEQKSAGVDLDKKEPRQEGQVTPVEQALRYADNLPFSLKPSVICTSDGRIGRNIAGSRAFAVSRIAHCTYAAPMVF